MNRQELLHAFFEAGGNVIWDLYSGYRDGALKLRKGHT